MDWLTIMFIVTVTALVAAIANAFRLVAIEIAFEISEYKRIKRRMKRHR